MYNSLPGNIVNIVDGGLTVRRAPKSFSTMVFGTAGKGIADQPYQVSDLNKALLEFGTEGSLGRALSEVASNSDNIVLFRMGTQAALLNGVGLDNTVGSATPGFNLTVNERTVDAGTRYKIWYKNGVMAVYLDGEVVFSNQAGQEVDNGVDVSFSSSIEGNAGLQLGTGTTPSLGTAITLIAAAALAGTADQPAPTFTAPVTGLGLKNRDLYIALKEATIMCEGIQVDQVIAPDATLDAPNVAYKLAVGDKNDPSTSADVLDWLRTVDNVDGTRTYTWAGVTAFTDRTDRVNQGFYEVNFGHLLASFCSNLSKLNKIAFTVLGTSKPRSFKLADVREWLGAPPVFAANGTVQTSGRGLLGNPYLRGCTTSKLNPLCSDYVTGRSAGFFETIEAEYDGTMVLEEENQELIDIGRHLHIFADVVVLSNSYGRAYLNNGAGLIAGFIATLDPKSGATNKPQRAGQIAGLVYTPTQLNALTEAKISVLRSQGAGNQPVALHDLTAATSASDYSNLVYLRVLSAINEIIKARGNKYIGESSLDGLQLASMKTELDQDLVKAQQRGYCKNPQIVIEADPVNQRIGHATVRCAFNPPDELVQLKTSIGFQR